MNINKMKQKQKTKSSTYGAMSLLGFVLLRDVEKEAQTKWSGEKQCPFKGVHNTNNIRLLATSFLKLFPYVLSSCSGV